MSRFPIEYTMRKILYFIFLFSSMFLLVLFPQTAYKGASEGLLLWFHTVLPTLLPYMILTNVLMSLIQVQNQTYYLFLPLLGLVCGYPMGAKICADLVREQRITQKMGQYLLPLCNLAGPSFLCGYVMSASLQLTKGKILYLACIYLPLFLYAILTGFLYRPNTIQVKTQIKTIHARLTFDESIMRSVTAITKLGGYIMLFSILSHLTAHILSDLNETMCLWIFGLLEITNGISMLTDSTLSDPKRIFLSLIFLNFGGISCLFQTNSMLQDSGLSIRTYFIAKCIISLFATIMAYVLFVR